MKKGILLIILFWTTLASSWASDFIVIVHPSNPLKFVERTYLSSIFLKKIKLWNDGSPVLPVDLSAKSSTREAFSQEIHKRPVSAIQNYWQRMIFSGREVAPPEFARDTEVISYILRNKNSIGYISANSKVSSVNRVIVK